MTNQQQQQPPYDPPRRPLRVHVSVRGLLGDGSSIVATAWRTLEPHEPEYEQAYQEAARAHRIYGWEMPYVDDAGDETGEGPPAGGESLSTLCASWDGAVKGSLPYAKGITKSQ